MDCYCVNLPSGDIWIYILIYMWIYMVRYCLKLRILALYAMVVCDIRFFIKINVIEMTRYNQEAFHYTRNSRDNFWVEDGVLNIK